MFIVVVIVGLVVTPIVVVLSLLCLALGLIGVAFTFPIGGAYYVIEGVIGVLAGNGAKARHDIEVNAGRTLWAPLASASDTIGSMWENLGDFLLAPEDGSPRALPPGRGGSRRALPPGGR